MVMRWETDTRYYGCVLQRDLLGDLVLFQYWGGRFNGLGSQSLKVVSSQAQALELVDQLNKARIKRGYHLVRGRKMQVHDAYEGEAREIIKTLSPRAKHVLTELYLEGKKASLECLRDFQAVEQGMITREEFMQRTRDREQD